MALTSKEEEEEAIGLKPPAVALTSPAAPSPEEEAADIPPTTSTPDDSKPPATPCTTPNDDKPKGDSLVQQLVETSHYGQGIVIEYRSTDGMYVIQLTPPSASSAPATTMSDPEQKPAASSASSNLLYTPQVPTLVNISSKKQQPSKAVTDDINLAYQALEQMRRLNLDVTAHEHGVNTGAIDYTQCTTCLLQQAKESRFPILQSWMDTASATAEDSTNFPRLRKWGVLGAGIKKKAVTAARNTANTSTAAVAAVASLPENEKQQQQSQQRVVLPRIQKLLDERQKASTAPCLICASPTCSTHASATFTKENITVCLECERLFELDFIVDCVSCQDVQERARHVDRMIDCYDRCLLLLKYSSQYVDTISTSLENMKEQQNQISLGSSGVGVLSGVLGIAAAATILTPAGPPLLVASLFFGGGATAVQTGNEVKNYFSEPNKLADRILALQGMVMSLLRVTSTLRDAMMRDHIRTDVLEAEAGPMTKEQVQEVLDSSRKGVLVGANVGRSLTLGGMGGARVATGGVVAAEGAVVAEVGAVAGARGATALSRSATAAARTIRIARFAGGALSAAVLVMEANSIQSTLKQIQEGSPCDKAESIRKISKELENLPTTAELDEECQAYLQALSNRPQDVYATAAVDDDAATIGEFPQADCQMAPIAAIASTTTSPPVATTSSSHVATAGTLIVDGEHDENVPVATPAATSSSLLQSSSFLAGASSLLGRLNQLPQPMATSANRVDEGVMAVVAESSAVRESQLDLIT